MKFSWSALLVAALGVSYCVPQTAMAAASLPCDFGELPFQLGTIVPPAFQCQTASGYSFVQPSTLPTAAQLKTICAKCGALLRAVEKAKTTLPTCALSMDNGNSITVDKLLNGVVVECARAAANPGGDTGSSNSRSSDGSHNEVEPPAGMIPTIAPTKAPTTAPVTPKPKKTTVKPSAAPSGSKEEDKASSQAPNPSAVINDIPPVPLVTPATPRPIAKKIPEQAVRSSSSAARIGVPSTMIAAATCIVAWSLLWQPL